MKGETMHHGEGRHKHRDQGTWAPKATAGQAARCKRNIHKRERREGKGYLVCESCKPEMARRIAAALNFTRGMSIESIEGQNSTPDADGNEEI